MTCLTYEYGVKNRQNIYSCELYEKSETRVKKKYKKFVAFT